MIALQPTPQPFAISIGAPPLPFVARGIPVQPGSVAIALSAVTRTVLVPKPVLVNYALTRPALTAYARVVAGSRRILSLFAEPRNAKISAE